MEGSDVFYPVGPPLPPPRIIASNDILYVIVFLRRKSVCYCFFHSLGAFKSMFSRV